MRLYALNISTLENELGLKCDNLGFHFFLKAKQMDMVCKVPLKMTLSEYRSMLDKENDLIHPCAKVMVTNNKDDTSKNELGLKCYNSGLFLNLNKFRYMQHQPLKLAYKMFFISRSS